MRMIFTFILLTSITFPTQAQRPDAPTYAQPGSYVVGTREFVLDNGERSLNGTIWYPSNLDPATAELGVQYQESLAGMKGLAVRDAEPNFDDAPYPLIIFSHGMGGYRFQSAYYIEHLASYGFVVISTEHPGSNIVDVVSNRATDTTVIQNFVLRPFDVLRQIEYAETLNAEGGELAGLIDLENIGVTGHSFGGYTTLAVGGGRIDIDLALSACEETVADGTSRFCEDDVPQIMANAAGLDTPQQGIWEAITDPHIKALVPLAPAGGTLLNMEQVTVPTLYMVGTGDNTTPADTNAIPMFESSNSAMQGMALFENAGHYIFVEECTDQMIAFGYFSSCSDEVWDMVRAHDLINHFATAFFLATLKHDNHALAALQPTEVNFAGIDYTFDNQ